MRRRILAVFGVMCFALLANPQGATACQRCGNGGFVCNGYDDCFIVVVCRAASFGQNSKVGCEVDEYGCYLTGDFCLWASHISPPEKQPATGSHETGT